MRNMDPIPSIAIEKAKYTLETKISFYNKLILKRELPQITEFSSLFKK